MKLALGSLLLLAALPLWAGRGPIPDVKFTDQDGKPFSTHSLKGSYALISFVFSKCPSDTMCPLTMRLTKRTLSHWHKTHPNLPLRAVAVTLDHKNDTPAALKAFGKAQGVDFARYTFLTGDEKTLESFASEFNVIGIPGEGTIAHNLKTVLVGPDLVPIRDFKDNEWKPEEVSSAVTTSKP